MSQHTTRRLTALCIAAVAAAGTMMAAATGASAASAYHGPFVGMPSVGTVSSGATAAATRSAEPRALPVDQGSHFVAIQPTRSFDTRTNGTGPLQGGRILTLDYKPGQIDPRVTAITYNLTVTNATADTYVTVYSPQGGAAVPQTSSINVRRGETRANQVTVPILRDSAGVAHVYIYNNAGKADVIFDTAGAYGTGEPDAGQTYTGYESVAPQRLLDTRTTGGPINGGSTRTISFAGKVAPNANAVTVNLTAISNTVGGYMTLYPGGTQRGNVSSINVQAGETTPNQVTVALGANQTLTLYNSAGRTDAIVDLLGAFDENASSALYVARERPLRVVDSRTGAGIHNGPLAPGESVAVLVGVPPENSLRPVAIVGNLTGIAGTAPTYLTTWPSGNRPTVSALNLAPRQTAANATSGAVTPAGALNLYNHSGNTDVVLDVSGYYVNPIIVG